MTHIFLTGEIQIGKSTVIKKTLSLLKRPFGGFRTAFGPDRQNPDRRLYLFEASSPPVFDEAHTVACFRQGLRPQAYPDQFDTLGVRYITEAREANRLIVMDECGALEKDALLFQKIIFETLEDTVPVLGVVKLSAAGWTDQLRSHPNIRLITVDENNREALPELLSDYYQRQPR